jgi:lipoyl-dependent peroxiredoxin
MSQIVKFPRRSGLCPRSGSRSMIRRAQAVCRGSAGAGCGAISVESATPAERSYSFMTSLASGNGTNPEELLAAAHASCFTMSLVLGLQAAGYTPAELSTEAVITLEADGASIRMGRSALTVRAKVPKLNKAAFEAIAWHAERTCTISKALRAQITLDAKLV